MARKIQVPSVGGLRKVIAGTAASTATTIAGLEGQSITLQQLALALGTIPASSSGTSASAVGGGGTLANPVVKLPPFPFILSDEGGDDPLVIQGPAGKNGIIGSNGAPGTTVMLPADEYDDPIIIPGQKGAAGTNGATGLAGATVVLTPDEYDDPIIIPGQKGAAGANGATGPAGATVFIVPEEGEDPIVVPGAAAPNTSSGGSISIKDGTNTIAGVTALTALNGYVQGATPNGSIYFPWSPDMPPVTPNSMNDEFDGTTLNARWGLFNINGSNPLTYALANSAITLTVPPDGGVSTRTWQGIYQALPSAPWAFVLKVRSVSLTATYNFMGFIIANAAGAACSWGDMWHSSYGEPCWYDGYSSNYTGHSVNDGPNANASALIPFSSAPTIANGNAIQTHWLELAFDGTTYTLGVSLDGLNFGSRISAPASSSGVTSPTIIALGGESINSSQAAAATYDYFRRTL